VAASWHPILASPSSPGDHGCHVGSWALQWNPWRHFGGESGLLGSLAEAASAMGMSIRLSAWGFGVAHGSYSGHEAGDLTGISFNLAPTWWIPWLWA